MLSGSTLNIIFMFNMKTTGYHLLWYIQNALKVLSRKRCDKMDRASGHLGLCGNTTQVQMVEG